MRSIRFMGDRLINEKVMSKFIFEKKKKEEDIRLINLRRI